MTQDQLDQFLNDYKQLMVKHNLRISSCGCCESPWLTAATEQSIEYAIGHLRCVTVVEG